MKTTTRAYTDKDLEAAARAAEDWKKHGRRNCRSHWENVDGFP